MRNKKELLQLCKQVRDQSNKRLTSLERELKRVTDVLTLVYFIEETLGEKDEYK